MSYLSLIKPKDAHFALFERKTAPRTHSPAHFAPHGRETAHRTQASQSFASADAK